MLIRDYGISHGGRPATRIGGAPPQNQRRNAAPHELLHPLGRGDRPQPSRPRSALRRDARSPARRARHHPGALLPRRPGRRRRPPRGLCQPADPGAGRGLRAQPAARDRPPAARAHAACGADGLGPGAAGRRLPAADARNADSAGRASRRRSSARDGGTASTSPPSARADGVDCSRSTLHSSSRSAAATWPRCGTSCTTSTLPTARVGARRASRGSDWRHQTRKRSLGWRLGLKADAIGYELGITGRAVEERLARARKMLGCRTTAEAVAKAVTPGACDPLQSFGISHRLWNFPRWQINHRLFHSPSRFAS